LLLVLSTNVRGKNKSFLARPENLEGTLYEPNSVETRGQWQSRDSSKEHELLSAPNYPVARPKLLSTGQGIQRQSGSALRVLFARGLSPPQKDSEIEFPRQLAEAEFQL
jgi:hypothetical protein